MANLKFPTNKDQRPCVSKHASDLANLTVWYVTETDRFRPMNMTLPLISYVEKREEWLLPFLFIHLLLIFGFMSSIRHFWKKLTAKRCPITVTGNINENGMWSVSATATCIKSITSKFVLPRSMLTLMFPLVFLWALSFNHDQWQYFVSVCAGEVVMTLWSNQVICLGPINHCRLKEKALTWISLTWAA